jgi:drug/metabolite transporter (DMT)-like permease
MRAGSATLGLGVASSTTALLLALICLQVALATFGVLAKAVLDIVPPLTLEGARRAFAGAILIAGVALAGRSIRPTRRDVLDAIVPGVIGFGLGRACVMVALSMTSATNVALIDSSAPAVALALSVVAGLERPDRRVIGASLVAFAGVAGLVVAGGVASAPNLGDLIALGSPVSWGAIYVWLGRRAPDPATRSRRTAWFCLAGAGALAVPALTPGLVAILDLIDPRVVGVLALGIAIGVAENTLTFRGIEVLGAVRTAEMEYLVPVLTAVTGLVLLQVPILPAQVAAIAVVLGALVVGGRARRARWRRQGPLPGQPCCVV